MKRHREVFERQFLFFAHFKTIEFIELKLEKVGSDFVPRPGCFEIKRILKFEAMSLRITTKYKEVEGIVSWEEKTRESLFHNHGPLFDRTFHFDEFPKVMFWARLSMDGNYLVAKKGPKVEFKIIEGTKMLDGLEDDVLEVGIYYFFGKEETANIGSVHITESIESLTEGYSKQKDDYYFSEIFGLKNNREISAKTFTYKLEIDLRFKESGKARPIPLSMGKKLSENLCLDSNFSDIKILCEGKIFYCHKVILSSQSEVFRSMLTNAMLTWSKHRLVKSKLLTLLPM